MRTTRRARREARRLYRACVVDGLLDEGRTQQVVERVAGSRRRGSLPILSHFQRLVKLDVERRTAHVESAIAPSDALQASVTANLARRYGSGLNITFGVNRELIGGLRVKVGSDVYDGSIKARLGALDESF